MRWIPATTLAALVLTAPAAANEREARAILDRAIRVHGGAAALEKAASGKRTDTGTQAVLSRDLPFVSQVARSLPDRLRLEMELDKRVTSTLVLNESGGWQAEGGGTASPLPPQRVRELREEVYVSWIATLAPLTRPEFRLTTIDKVKIDGEPAVGIRVSRRGNADARLYFLERNGLLAKIERRVHESGREVDKEYLYSGYKEFGGATLPTKETIKVNREKFTEFTISNYQFLDKFGAATFARP